MRIRVEIAFSFKHQLGDEDYRALDVPIESTVLDVLRSLGDRYAVFKARVFDDAGKVRPNINVLINGGNVRFREGFATVLVPGDRLSVLPPVGGG
jgi:MoaD family protein